MRVLAALSGGVDSAVAAALAVEAGHDVVGVHLALSRAPAADGQGCWSADDALDARRAAEVLGIELEVWDLSETFAGVVVEDFLAEYAAGRTPNPCVRCNDTIKLGELASRAQALGFDAVCTGHYARTSPDGTLRRAVCVAKDQSYVLAVAGPQRLARTLLPLGEIASKDDVRATAAARGLPMATKPDSFDLCFVPDGDLSGFLSRRLGPQPGDVVDTEGNVVGHHEGTYGFTVGQRRGLALGRPAPDGRPRYVLAVEPVRRQVVVGPAEALDVTALTASAPVWFVSPQPASCLVQVRAHATPVPGTVTPTGTGVEVRLDAPIRGVAAGQSVVCYDDDRVLVQAVITTASTKT
ncbi:MAG: tRNA 2-thiouridine(34) synthase MnmA [Micrococcales bacterium]|nr:tRNA 2-thiouridine(34) synthase MnmA [Micrococcales bacterium]